MGNRELPLSVQPASLLPARIGSFIRPFEPALQRFLFPDPLLRSFERAAQVAISGASFADRLLQELNIGYELPKEELERIPPSGGAVVVANHPFGFLEGLILVSALSKVRSDFRIVANSVLAPVSKLTEYFLFVNSFSPEATGENAKGLRGCVRWLQSEGLLVFFPAGSVSHLSWQEQAVSDSPWNDTAARLARLARRPVVPIFFEGANSIPFQMAGVIHPALRTLNLPRELVKMQKRTVRVRVGRPVPTATMQMLEGSRQATDYLRARVYLLSSRAQERERGLLAASLQSLRPRSRSQNVAAPCIPSSLKCEIERLPPTCLLASSEDFAVYVANAAQIPECLIEIGRCREIAFRAAGEGTGKALDIDRFDEHYQHLFLWCKREERIAGAYRLVGTPDVLPTRGVGGLYTSTLFDYDSALFERLGPAFELGRSFILPDYQKHYGPLLMLWRGIAAAVARRPECAVLFGAVSVSADYHALSRTLLVDFATAHMRSDLAEFVRPRRGFRKPIATPKHVKRLSSLLVTLDELSACISDLERDGKAMPVLIRQYAKVGGRFLGFSVDRNFSNTLDGLIMADLRKAPPEVLLRWMGRTGASAFQAHHATPQS